jgi:hypothetical protein
MRRHLRKLTYPWVASAILMTAFVALATLTVMGLDIASKPVTIEAEAATLAHGAKVIESNAASGGKYVVFGSAATAGGQTPATSNPTSTPTSPSGGGGGTSGGGSGGGGGSPVFGWPGPYNTGYPHGVSGDTRAPVTLSAYTGSCTITTPGTVIDRKDITCRLNIRTTGVVIKNSRIRVSNEGGVNINDYYHAVIMDTEIDGQRQDNSAGGISLVGDGSYICIRCNLHGSGDIVRANWGGVALVDSWLHDLYCLQSSCHNDGIQSTGPTCGDGASNLGPIAGSSDTTSTQYCLRIIHNRIENANNQTSDILLKADLGAISSVLVENNLFSGGGYTFYWYDSGYQISNGLVRNNRFRRDVNGPVCTGGVSPNLGDPLQIASNGYWPKGGCYGPVASNVPAPSRYPTWTNNVWDDNNAVITF